MTKQTILTGVRANGDLTIGNYFGAIKPIIDTAIKHANDYQINLFIPDLHSFTTPVDHSELYSQIINNAKVFTAAGLPFDNDSIHMYRQSFVPAHSELAWILDCFTGFGEMNRMTQFKDKSKNIYSLQEAKSKLLADIDDKNSDMHALYVSLADDLKGKFIEVVSFDIAEKTSKELVSVGLFNYPVLMAADILLYDATYVPVGDDQTQHLEFTRNIAERFNNRFGDIFTVPKPVDQQNKFFGAGDGLRIKDLIDPSKKMSKSDEAGRGVIYLSDTPSEAAKKIMGAATDDLAQVRLDFKNQPGVSNLLQILSLVRSQAIEQTASEFSGVTRYGDFKKVVAGEVAQFLEDFQSKLASVDDEYVESMLRQSEQTVATQANQTLLRAQQAVGLRSKQDS